MDGVNLNYMFFQSKDMIKFYKKKFIYKYYHILKKTPVFYTLADFLDDETLLELKFTCKKFKSKIEEEEMFISRSNRAELKKVKSKLVK